MKKTILLIVLLLIINKGYSQIFEKGFSIGVNAGVTQPYADTYDSDITGNFGLGVQYHITPYMALNADFVKSVLERHNLDRYHRSYHNSFNHLTLMGNISLGQFISKKIGNRSFLNNFYGSAGVGVINSKVTKPESEVTDIYGGKKYNGSDLFIPVAVGYDFRLARQGKIVGNINYQANYSFSDALDGYAGKTNSKSNDAYSMLTVGVKFLFGRKSDSSGPTSLQCYY